MARFRKVLICGASRLPRELKPLARALGRSIIDNTQLQMITGGLKERIKGVPTTDFEAADAALEAVRKVGADPMERIITMLPRSDVSSFERFRYGQVTEVPKSTLKARRFAMVLSSDAVVAIGGSKGTSEIIDLAWIAEKPILPIPCTGAAAKERWDKYYEEIQSRLDLRDNEIDALSSTPLDVERIVSTCVAILRRVLRPHCFVAMKIEQHPLTNCYEAIRDIVLQKGYIPVRVDQEPSPGNIVNAIWDSIRASEIVIGDLTDYNPNVLYELGISHALGKDTVLTIFSETGRIPSKIPFDIHALLILPYGTLASLRAHLEKHVPEVT